MLIQAESGLASITGGPEAPARVGVSVCDIAAGLNAYQAVLEALIARGRTNEGAALSVSMFDAMAEWMTTPLLQHEGGAPPQRVGLAHTSIAPYGVFRTRDGADILISIQSDREWRALAEKVLGDAALAPDPAFATNVERVQAPRRDRWPRRRGLRRDRRGAADRSGSPPPTSRSAASTTRRRSPSTRTCAASRSARRAARCPVRPRPSSTRHRRAGTDRCRRWASIPTRCARSSFRTPEPLRRADCYALQSRNSRGG